MFSAQQLQKFAGKKRITQGTFDEAVEENIEEFEMATEEAVASAVAEFQSQGVDLSNIITTASRCDLSEHPLTKTLKKLEAAVDSADHSTSQKTLDCLRLAAIDASSTPSSSSSSSSDKCRQFGAMANSFDAVTHIINALKQGTSDHNIDTQIAAAGALRALLPLSSDMKTRFLRAEGVKALAAAVTTLIPTTAPNGVEDTKTKITSKSDAQSSERKHQLLAAALLQAVAASTIKAEYNKCAAMEADLGSLTLRILRQSSSSSSNDDSSTNAVVIAICAVLGSLTSADDESLPSSRAFLNARQLAMEGAAEALVSSLRIYTTVKTSSNSDYINTIDISGNISSTNTNRDVIIALCSTLRQVAANDDICQEAAGSGAVPLALQLADRGLDTQDMELLRAALNVLKQLASSDGIKAEVFEAGGLETLKESLKLTTDQLDDENSAGDNANINTRSVAVVEQALGLLTNITLRNPEISTAAVSSGCVGEVLRAMHALLDTAHSSSNNLIGKKAESSLRQGCMAIRNIAARCPEERQVLLAEGAEKLLRGVKKVFSSSCEDVGSAALRDLGLDNYNN